MDRKQKAVALYRAFHGHDPEYLDTVTVTEYDVVCKIGDCLHIAYQTPEGERYIHRFKKACRPILAVSPDGKQLILLSGSYEFTELGIVDI